VPDSDHIAAYIALGANLGDREANLRDALARLTATPGVEVARVSAFLDNPAVGGPADGPAFLNAAAEIRTPRSPREILTRLLQIEQEMGRERREKWGPRLIDLDLLLFGDQVIDEPDIKVPHPLMHERDFVLIPLAEIAPDVMHPVFRRTIGDLAAERHRRNIGVPPVRTIQQAASPESKTSQSQDRAHGRDARVTTTLVLRPATNADGESVRDVVFSVLREYGLQPDPCATDLDLFDLEGHYAMKGGRFDVLVDEQGIIRGTVGLGRVDDQTCELRKMYLHRSIRGQGWGRRVLEHALAEARRMGFKHVALETATPLKEAIALYVRYGFKPYTPAHMVPRCDQAYELWL
jgi:2-amino-4-hydroxy-6-hydroxymethyldihydropteridine diphosphokinase